MVAAKSLRQRRSLLVNVGGFILALAISVHLIPVPSPSEVVSAAVQTVAAIAKPSKAKPETLFFPIKGYSYSKDLVTDRPGSPRPGGKVHAGIDLDTYDASFEVIAIRSGVVDELKPDTEVGGIIAISSKDKRGNTITDRLVHLDREPLRRFKLGDRIEAGEVVGTVSTTFLGSTNSHLHYERYVNNSLDWNVERSLTWTKPLEVARV